MCFVERNLYEGVLLLPSQSIFCYQLFHGYSLLTASELCGRHEHPVGSSVEMSDSAIDWNVDEQMNLTTVFLSVVLCSNQSAYRRRSNSKSFLALLV